MVSEVVFESNAAVVEGPIVAGAPRARRFPVAGAVAARRAPRASPRRRRRLPARLSGAGVDERHGLGHASCAGAGHRRDVAHQLRARAGQVRARDADGDDPIGAAARDSETEAVRARQVGQEVGVDGARQWRVGQQPNICTTTAVERNPRKGKRVYRTVRIPVNVYARVVTRLTRVA